MGNIIDKSILLKDIELHVVNEVMSIREIEC